MCIAAEDLCRLRRDGGDVATIRVFNSDQDSLRPTSGGRRRSGRRWSGASCRCPLAGIRLLRGPPPPHGLLQIVASDAVRYITPLFERDGDSMEDCSERMLYALSVPSLKGSDDVRDFLVG